MELSVWTSFWRQLFQRTFPIFTIRSIANVLFVKEISFLADNWFSNTHNFKTRIIEWLHLFTKGNILKIQSNSVKLQEVKVIWISINICSFALITHDASYCRKGLLLLVLNHKYCTCTQPRFRVKKHLIWFYKM